MKTINEIAKEMKISRQSLYHRIKVLGLHTNPQYIISDGKPPLRAFPDDIADIIMKAEQNKGGRGKKNGI